jgi:hypothetical protein
LTFFNLINFDYLIIDEISHYFPKEIGHKLIKLHADPKAFWFGQFIGFIMRSNQMIDQLLKKVTEKLELPEIYVG